MKSDPHFPNEPKKPKMAHKHYEEFALMRLKAFANCTETHYMVTNVTDPTVFEKIIWYMMHDGTILMYNLGKITESYKNNNLYTLTVAGSPTTPVPCFMSLDQYEEIEYIWVHKDIRRRGIGSQLVKEGPSAGRHVTLALSKSVPFWDKMGYSIIDVSMDDDIKNRKRNAIDSIEESANKKYESDRKRRRIEGVPTPGDQIIDAHEARKAREAREKK